jgi:hypothetical protein
VKFLLCGVGTLSLLSSGLLAGPVFRLSDVGLPPGVQSHATDLNDNGSLVGMYSDGTNAYVFVSRAGNATIIPEPGVGAWPHAINNREVIVGAYNPPPIRSESGGFYWHMRAWMHSGGTNYLLGEKFTDFSEAFGINNRGDIVGYVGEKGYILSEPQTSMSTYEGGIPNRRHANGSML